MSETVEGHEPYTTLAATIWPCPHCGAYGFTVRAHSLDSGWPWVMVQCEVCGYQWEQPLEPVRDGEA